MITIIFIACVAAQQYLGLGAWIWVVFVFEIILDAIFGIINAVSKN